MQRTLSIRDLTGARRDATTLWALFSNTLPGINAARVVDAGPTVERVRRALDKTLGAAGPEDTVILTFSGHGTHDHRLVAHDTAGADLQATTIPMREVVSRLRQSRAGAVLCVLDCCFSGGAPARATIRLRDGARRPAPKDGARGPHTGEASGPDAGHPGVGRRLHADDEEGTAESVRRREAAQKYGPETVRAMQSFARAEWDYLARCKRAALLWDWVSGVPLETIEQRYTPNPFQGRIGHGDARKFADATRYRLRSAHQIASVMFAGEGPSEEAIEALLRQLEAGLTGEALGLLSLPLSLSRGEYLALHAAGISASEQFWATAEESLVGVLGAARAAQCLKLRPGRE